jgi:hypothetical protein
MARRQFEELATINPEGAAIIDGAMGSNAVVQYQLSGADTYSGTLMGIHTMIEQAAAEIVAQQVMEEGGPQNFSAINIQAMTAVEAFRQVSSLDLTAVLLRAYYLRMIQEQNLLANHPAQYSSLSDMAAQNACSVTDMLATLDMVNILFPYIENELGIPVHELWATVGKSKLKEMLPVLKVLITNEGSDTESVQAAIERLMDEQYASFRVDEQLADAIAILDDEEAPEAERETIRERLNGVARRNIVQHLIELGGQLPITEVRRHLRPQRTTPIFFQTIQDGTSLILMGTASQEQFEMLQNKMGERMDITTLALPEDPRARQAEAFRIPLFRRVYALLNGGNA